MCVPGDNASARIYLEGPDAIQIKVLGWKPGSRTGGRSTIPILGSSHKRPFVGVSQGTVLGFGDGFGIWGRFWSHFVGNSRQKLTNLSKFDF